MTDTDQQKCKRGCGRNAYPGAVECWQCNHAPQVIRAANRRLLEQEARAIVLKEYAGDYPEMEDPASELLKIATEYTAVKDVLGRMASELESVAHENRAGDSQVIATWQAYVNALNHCAEILTKINKLGLSDHHATLEEDRGIRVGNAIRSGLADISLGLGHERQREILATIARQLDAAFN